VVSKSNVMRRSGRVLVLGWDTRSFLSVIRSLGRAGLDVHVAWCPLYSPSLRSRYVRAVHSIPYYRPDDSHWVEMFNELVSRYEFDLVIPSDDASLVPLQMHMAKLARVDCIYLLSDQAYQVTSDKEQTYELARKLGITLPRQLAAATRAELDTAIADLGIPTVVKPRRSAESDNPQSRRFVKKIRHPADVELIAAPMLATGPVLVQEHFPGIGVGVETLCREGEILVAFQHERVHEPLQGGGSSYRRSVPLNSELLEAARRFLRAIEYTGVCMVEFRYNPQSRRWVLIETNGRFWGSLPLALAAGVDFPRYLYEMLKYGRTEFPSTYTTNLYCRNWFIDLGWLRSNIFADKSDPTLMALPLPRVAAEVYNVLRLREHSDTLTMDDPAPALEEIGGLLARAFVAVISYMKPLRRYMKVQVLRALKNASSVLFVCKGNICRSPFAEYYARTRLPDLEISSVGLLLTSGRAAPAAAMEGARAWNIDLSQHRSRTLTAADLNGWDVVFVFDLEHFRTVTRLARKHKTNQKIFFLGSLDSREHLEIADPSGKDARAFEATYDRIARLIDTGAAAIDGNVTQRNSSSR
jgi:protein-tyrosine-phosphatase/predicted ATP-grasp superfamily ATP-dependent carboligase